MRLSMLSYNVLIYTYTATASMRVRLRKIEHVVASECIRINDYAVASLYPLKSLIPRSSTVIIRELILKDFEKARTCHQLKLVRISVAYVPSTPGMAMDRGSLTITQISLSSTAILDRLHRPLLELPLLGKEYARIR